MDYEKLLREKESKMNIWGKESIVVIDEDIKISKNVVVSNTSYPKQKPLCYSSKSHCKRRCREGNSSAFTSIRRGWKPLNYTRPARQRRYQPLERDYLRG